jgi:crotonobetainyl-CoA dehydrogenase
MDFNKTEEQELLLISEEKVQQWYEDNRVPAEVMRSYLDAGFGYLGLPEELGGTPCSVMTNCMVVEELSRYAGAVLPFMQNSVAMFDMVDFGSPEQVKFCMYLYKETGQAPFSIAVSEPNEDQTIIM